MQSRQHQVTGFGRGQSGADGFNVAHFSDQNHVGVLTQRIFERGSESHGVGVQFALFYQRHDVVMNVFDRVFDGDDVFCGGPVDQIDQTGQSGGFSASGRSGDQDQPLLLGHQPQHLGRQPQFLGGRNPVGNHARHHADGTALKEAVHAEPETLRRRVRCMTERHLDRQGEVQLPFFLEDHPLARGDDAVEQPLGVAAGQGGQFQRPQISVDPEHRAGAGRKQEVAGAELDRAAQQSPHIHEFSVFALIPAVAEGVDSGLHPLEQQPELVDVGGGDLRRFQRNDSIREELEDRTVEGDHTIFLTAVDRLFEIIEIAFMNQPFDGRGSDQQFECRDHSRTVFAGEQPLRRDSDQRHGEVGGNLCALVLGEEVDNPFDRLNGVGGVGGGQHQVAGQRR